MRYFQFKESGELFTKTEIDNLPFAPNLEKCRIVEVKKTETVWKNFKRYPMDNAQVKIILDI